MPLVLRRLELLEKGGLQSRTASTSWPRAAARHRRARRRHDAVPRGRRPRTRGDRGRARGLHRHRDRLPEGPARAASRAARHPGPRRPAGMPRAFDRMALPYLQRIFDAFPGLVRIYHNDTPCAHLLPRIGQLHCEVWNFSHEMDIAAVGPRRRASPSSATWRASRHLVRGTRTRSYGRRARASTRSRRAAGSSSPPAEASPGTPAENIDALVEGSPGVRDVIRPPASVGRFAPRVISDVLERE